MRNIINEMEGMMWLQLIRSNMHLHGLMIKHRRNSTEILNVFWFPQNILKIQKRD